MVECFISLAPCYPSSCSWNCREKINPREFKEKPLVEIKKTKSNMVKSMLDKEKER
jgi:hypothetical protein